MNLMQMVLGGQEENQIQQLAKTFGIGEAQVQEAMAQMVPALSRGLQTNISSESGLDGLMQALQTGDHRKYVEQPETLAEEGAVQEGNAILGHILGGKDASRALADEAHAQTGLDTGMLKKMLPVVASLVMGSLSKQAADTGLSSGQASSGLAGMLTGFLDADKDGSVVDDLMGMAGKFFR